MAACFAEYDIAGELRLLEQHGGLKIDHTLKESMQQLIDDWSKSKFEVQERLIITVRNKEVDALNKGIRELLKTSGVLKVRNIDVIYQLRSMKIIWQEIGFYLR